MENEKTEKNPMGLKLQMMKFFSGRKEAEERLDLVDELPALGSSIMTVEGQIIVPMVSEGFATYRARSEAFRYSETLRQFSEVTTEVIQAQSEMINSMRESDSYRRQYELRSMDEAYQTHASETLMIEKIQEKARLYQSESASTEAVNQSLKLSELESQLSEAYSEKECLRNSAHTESLSVSAMSESLVFLEREAAYQTTKAETLTRNYESTKGLYLEASLSAQNELSSLRQENIFLKTEETKHLQQLHELQTLNAHQSQTLRKQAKEKETLRFMLGSLEQANSFAQDSLSLRSESESNSCSYAFTVLNREISSLKSDYDEVLKRCELYESKSKNQVSALDKVTSQHAFELTNLNAELNHVSTELAKVSEELSTEKESVLNLKTEKEVLQLENVQLKKNQISQLEKFQEFKANLQELSLSENRKGEV